MHFIQALLLTTILTLQIEAQTRTQVLMGTFVSITVEENKKNVLPLAFSTFKEVENSLSSYNDKALLYQLNHNREVLLDKNLQEALLLSQRYFQQTAGHFNIAIGSVSKTAYHFGEDEQLPTQRELKNIDVRFDDLHIKDNRAYLEGSSVLDLGGMGKGFGVDKVKEVLKQHGVRKAVVAASGDIYCLNTCHVAIQNPFNEGTLFTLYLHNKALTTSGNYRRYVASKEHNHLINPYTKESEKVFASITLISELPNADIDAYATAASVMSFYEALQFLQKLKVAYILVLNDATRIVSGNIYEYCSSVVLNSQNVLLEN